ncbi:DUF2490 domain-containing protein [Marinoscillum pacificum]|uniref:DUF2490 domain-containing protein n=1 Tax=Marinoscillum pacificum TaxID=392723 RepID=UPI00215865B4|nr:DUF2490 domain-containing protein [Marinoscillum pacificum]
MQQIQAVGVSMQWIETHLITLYYFKIPNIMFTKTKLSIVLIGLGLLGTYQQTFGQEVHGKANVWYLLLINHKLNDQWNLGSEIHMRYDDWMNSEAQFLFRPYIDFNTKSNPNVVYTFGYTYVKTYPYGDYPLPIGKPENNVWEQITLKHQVNQLKIQHRYRLEQRWQRDISYNDAQNQYELDGTSFSGRFRYRLTMTQLLSDTYFVNVFDELWIRGSNQSLQYDRNWLYVGLGANLSSNYSIQLAYLHQYAQNNPERYERHHGVQVTGSVKI